MISPVLLAGVNADNAVREWTPSSSSTIEGVVIFGSLILVTLIVFGWVVFFRTRGHRRHSHSHRHSPGPAANAPAAGSPGKKSFWRARRQHRRRHGEDEPLPRNPTLAEERGLPPVRKDGQPPLV
jgi:hypothetical protein